MCNIIDLMFDLNTEENNIHIKTKSMLNNGLNFISDSIDHFLNFEQQNTLENTSENILFNELKYSVLHLHSGIALVLKSVLFFNQWTYIFSDMNKASQKELNDGSFKSVESNKLISRFSFLYVFENEIIFFNVFKSILLVWIIAQIILFALISLSILTL